MTVNKEMMMMVNTKAKLQRENVNLAGTNIVKPKKQKKPNKLMLHCQRGGMD